MIRVIGSIGLVLFGVSVVAVIPAAIVALSHHACLDAMSTLRHEPTSTESRYYSPRGSSEW